MIALFKENKSFQTYLGYEFFSGLGGGVFTLFLLLYIHLVYANPLYTGIAGFLVAVPFIFSFAIGPTVDKSKKTSVLRWTTLLECAALASLAFTPLHEQIGILFIFVLIIVFAIAAVFENPASTALLPQIVQAEKIMKANSFIEITKLIGALGIAAILFISLRAGSDANYSFIFGLSTIFLAVAFLFSLFLKESVANGAADKPAQNYFSDLKAGARFIKGNVLLFILIASTSMALIAEITSINRPEFYEYHAGAQGYIIFMVMALIGGIISSILAGTIGNSFKVGRLMFALLLITGAVRITFVFVIPSSLLGAYIIAIFYAAFSGPISILIKSLGQQIPSKDMVGRVSTIFTTIAAIFIAIGALLGGVLGSIVPIVDHIFIFHGVSYAAIGVLVLLVPSIRKLPKINEINKSIVN